MNIAVIGAGPAGLMAAASIPNPAFAHRIVVYERNEKAGKKLYITGKGRCNFTNLCAPDEFLSNVVSGSKFLKSALYAFGPEDAMRFMQQHGCPVKVERGNRAFPVSDKASDITKALTRAAAENGASFAYGYKADSITKQDGVFCIRFENGEAAISDKVIIACGGKSFPSTGSDGSGFEILSKMGHRITGLVPALVQLKVREHVRNLEGLSLKNVSAQLVSAGVGKAVCSQFGEMLFRQEGLSGPIILSLSAFLPKVRAGEWILRLDLKPALDRETLDQRLLRDFSLQMNKQLRNALYGLLPRSMVPYLIGETGIDGEKQVNLITRAERAKLVETVKCLNFHIVAQGGFEEAIVTNGGVELTEINSSTLESRLISGLFLAGEVLDVHALTGGFNIQIALATGYKAGSKCIL